MAYGIIDICAVRVAKLTEAGAPLTGANHGYVSLEPTKLTANVNALKGDDLSEVDGCGTLKFAYQSPDKPKSATLTLDLCELDFELRSVMLGEATYVSGSTVVGTEAVPIGQAPPPVCFEAWARAWNGNAQAVDASTSPDATYFHLVWPYTRWSPANVTYSHAFSADSLTGVGLSNTLATVNGPFDDWPASVVAGNGVTSYFGEFYDTIPATAGFVAVTAAS